MIKELSNLAQVQNNLQNATAKTSLFNAALPLRLEVLEKYHSVRYMVKIGNITLETKSAKELEVGAKYWAMMAKSQAGSIMLSQLIKQPNLLKDQNSPLKLSPKDIKEFLQEEGKPFEIMKQFLLEKLSQATTRSEFLFLSHMLLSLKNQVLTLPFGYDDEGQEGFLQIKKPKKPKSIEFYSVFPNLGATLGLLTSIQENKTNQIYLDLKVMYPSIAKLLERNLDQLGFACQASIYVDSNIAPLYDFGSDLLNIWG